MNEEAQNENEVKSLIDKASKQIKENAKKRKEEQEANAANGFGMTLDGKPDKFPFKSIKPKKAFLLGSPANDNSDSSEENTDGSVNMQSPDQQSTSSTQE